MAEATALRNNALPYPVYGVPWTVVFPMLDADGDLVTGATTPDAEVSKNGDTFADCTNESTEIATNSGMYYLTLTGTEMTSDIVAVIAKSATAGMKTTPIVLYPRKLVSLRTGTVAANAADGTTLQLDSGASAVDDYYNGCLLVGVLDSTTEARIISDYVGSTKVCTVSPAFNTAPDNNDTFTVYLPEGRQITQADAAAIDGVAWSTHASGMAPADLRNIAGSAVSTSTAQLGVNVVNFGGSAGTFASGRPEVNTSHIAGSAVSTSSAQIGVNVVNAGGTAWGSGAITAATFAADVDAEILSYLVDDATRIDASALNTATGTTIPAIVADTNELQTDWANGGRLDLLIDAILEDTGTTLQAELDGIQADTEDLQAKLGTPSDFGSGTSTIAANLQDMADNGTATFDRSTDSLQALRDRGDAAWITATGFSTHSAADVWAVGTRALTVLDEDSTTLDLDATIRAAVGLAAANLDTQIGDLPTNSELTTSLGTADDAVLAAIATTDGKVDGVKAKTDSLTFTVAGQVDANIQYVNDTQVNGSGTAGSPWGP